MHVLNGLATRNPVTAQTVAVRGVAWAFLASLSGRLIATAVLVVLARLLTPEDFGLVALAGVFVGLLSLVRDGGLAAAIIQKRAVTNADLSTAFWTTALAGAVLTGVAYLLAGPVSSLLRTPGLEPVLGLLSLTFVLGALRTVPGALLTRRMNFRAVAVRNIIGTTAGGAAGIVAALAGAGVYALVIQALVDVLAELLVVAVAARWRPSLVWDKGSFHALTSFGWRVLGAQVLNFLARQSDDLLIGAFLGPVALGLYSVAYRLLRVVLDLSITVITTVALPALSRVQDDRARLSRGFARALEAAATVCVPAFVLLGYLAPDLIVAVFGSEWREAGRVMTILAIGGVAQPLFLMNVQALIAAGLPSWSLRLSLANAVSSVLAFSLAVRFGLTAVALAFSVRALLMVPVSLAVTRSQLGFSAMSALRCHVAPLVGATVMLGALIAARPILVVTSGEAARLAVIGGLVLVALMTYAAVLRIVAPQQTARTVGLLKGIRRSSRGAADF